jgi:AcrR family transcriptional regulator
MLTSVKNDVDQLPKLSREKWLELAIQALADDCKSKFSLDSLIKAMPVSKGSFYSHFKNRSDFLIALVDYWDRHDTQGIIDAIKQFPEDLSAEDRLWELTLAIRDLQLNRYELLIRSLAFEFPETRDAIEKVDRRRIESLRAIFADMGFEGMECEVRARVFVTAISQEDTVFNAVPDEDYEEFRLQRQAFFTRH